MFWFLFIESFPDCAESYQWIDFLWKEIVEEHSDWKLC